MKHCSSISQAGLGSDLGKFLSDNTRSVLFTYGCHLSISLYPNHFVPYGDWALIIFVSSCRVLGVRYDGHSDGRSDGPASDDRLICSG